MRREREILCTACCPNRQGRKGREANAETPGTGPGVSAFARCVRGLGAAHVGAFGGVDADLFALVNEGRNLDDEAGFRLGGLGD